MEVVSIGRAIVLIAGLGASSWSQGVPDVQYSGTVKDKAGQPVAAAQVKVERLGLTVQTDASGNFSIGGSTPILRPQQRGAVGAAWGAGSLEFGLASPATVTASVFGVDGKIRQRLQRAFSAGSHSWRLPELPEGNSFIEFVSPEGRFVLKATRVEGATAAVTTLEAPVAKASADPVALYDEITVTKAGYRKHFHPVTSSVETGMSLVMEAEDSDPFSFFVTSMLALIDLSGNDQGFGGDYRFGETGPGAGLRGADKICRTIAERVMPGAGARGWRAFLSVTEDPHGEQVDAIDRVGEGPWYDFTGRIVSEKKADLLQTRPATAHADIINNLPNENGIGNHRPDPTKPEEDNHHTMTGSNEEGRLESATATCKDWTVGTNDASAGQPAGGFSWPRGGGGGPGGSFGGSHWMTTWNSPGCNAGIEIINGGGPTQQAQQGRWIGGGGGYGGFYCFALTP